MSKPISRKFRPKCFNDIVGQKFAVALMKSALSAHRISNCYLFFGPRGTGKTSMARIFAKGLNCLNRADTEAPCSNCSECLDIDRGVSLNVIELDAASNRGVEDIRRLCMSALYGTQGYKVYIIDEAHMLTKEAFNAFLKTIEEPSDRVSFILVTTEKDKIPPPVSSRSQLIPFRQVEDHDLKARLGAIVKKEELIIHEDVLSLIAKMSEGCIRDAESLLEQVIVLSQQAQQLDVAYVRALFGLPSSEIFEQLDALSLDRSPEALNKGLELVYEDIGNAHNFEAFFKEGIEYYHKQLQQKLGLDKGNIKEQLRSVIASRDLAFYDTVFRELYVALEHCKQNGLGEVLITMFIMRLLGDYNVDCVVENKRARACGALKEIQSRAVVTGESISSEGPPIKSDIVDDQLGIKVKKISREERLADEDLRAELLATALTFMVYSGRQSN